MHCGETVLKQPGCTCRTFKSAEAKSVSLQGNSDLVPVSQQSLLALYGCIYN